MLLMFTYTPESVPLDWTARHNTTYFLCQFAQLQAVSCYRQFRGMPVESWG